MNKKILFLLPGLAFAMTACGQGEDPNPVVDVIHVESVSLNKTTLEIEEGAQEVLTATVTPENASVTAVTWSSDNTAVATVSSTGKVTGVSAGTANITVKTVDGEKTAVCAVTVKQEGAEYGSLSNPKSVSEVLAIAARECVNDKDYTKQRVYVKGIIRNKIAKKTLSSGAQVWGNVYIKDLEAAGTEVLAYNPNYVDTMIVYQNDEVILSGYMQKYGTTLEFTSKSSEYPLFEAVTHKTSTITSVVENGTITGLPAQGLNGSEISFTVTPDANMVVLGVTVNGTEIQPIEEGGNVYKTVIQGDTEIAANINVPGAKICEMKYSGSTTNMVAGNNAATVGLDADQFTVESGNETGIYAGLNQNGQIRLYNAYKAEQTKGNGTSLTISSRVNDIVNIVVTLDGGSPAPITDLSVKVGGEEVTGNNGKYVVNGSSVTLKNVCMADASKQIYISSIRITYVEKEKVAATGIALNKTTLALEAGQSETLTATLTPADSTDIITWTSSDETVATVEAGVVTALDKAGTVTIKAAVSDTLFAECALTVTKDETNYGTKENPLTIEEAKAIADAQITGNGFARKPIYVKGVVVTNTAYDASYQNTKEIWISNGLNEKQFEFYCGVFEDVTASVTYAAADSLVGKTVIGYGYLQRYNTTLELSKKNDLKPTIVSIEDVKIDEVKNLKISSVGTSVDLDGTLELKALYDINMNAAPTISWSVKEGAVGSVEFPEPATGATITVTGKTSGAVTVVATSGSVSAEIDLVVEEDNTNYGTVDAPITVAQAKAIIDAQIKAEGDFTKKPMFIQGTIEGIDGKTFHNGDYFGQWNIKDGEDSIYVANTKKVADGVDTSTLGAGDVVVLKGYAQNYVTTDTSKVSGIQIIKGPDKAYPSVEKVVTKAPVSVTLGAHDHATVTGLPEQPVAFGSTVEFTVAVDSGYELVDVQANGNALTANEGTYSFVANTATTIVVNTKEEGSTVTSAVFELGEDDLADSGKHADGSSASTYTEVANGKTLSISNGTYMYTGAKDDKGNGCLKFGTSKANGSFDISFAGITGLKKVIIKAASYKTNKDATISLNGGTAIALDKKSNDGVYVSVEYTVGESDTKLSVALVKRAMVNSIEFVF